LAAGAAAAVWALAWPLHKATAVSATAQLSFSQAANFIKFPSSLKITPAYG
jgi:hypothetical protein